MRLTAIRPTLPATLIALSGLLPAVSARAQSPLPDAPIPQLQAPCVLLAALEANDLQATFPPAAPPAEQQSRRRNEVPTFPAAQPVCGVEQCTAAQALMSCGVAANPFLAVMHSEMRQPLTARAKAVLAARDVLDPFNLLTIAGTSTISIASNADTAYGPGVRGWGKLTGVTLTEDMTGEFFGTFLIPSIVHQDPHYHRMPNAALKRRIAHCIYQVMWAQADDGRGIFTYATVVGTGASEAVNNLYVPYRHHGSGAAGERYWTALATDPIGNFITEFVPDLARRLNVRILLVQRIVNRVAIEDGGN